MERHAIRNGIYPTMITPYTPEGTIDENAVRELTRWYMQNGCTGIFAVCQSSEIFYLTLEERIRLVRLVKEEVDLLTRRRGGEPVTVVASGHVSDDREAQLEELNAVWEAGADAVVLISNRMDIGNQSESAWVKDMESLAGALSDGMRLGIYECPYPYKRLLTSKMLQAVIDTGRFEFFKDTCCNPELLEERLARTKESGLKLFNANAQTLLHSLKCGGSGYSGVMANFQPKAYVWMYDNYQKEQEKAEQLQVILSMSAFSEALAYPVTAKYYLRTYESLRMTELSRSCSKDRFGSYDKMVMGQLKRLNDGLEQWFTNRGVK